MLFGAKFKRKTTPEYVPHSVTNVWPDGVRETYPCPCIEHTDSHADRIEGLEQ
jgi:hypothetical protein